MVIRTIEWRSGSVRIIDQTKLPARLEYLHIRDIGSLWRAIKELKVRGAPALGAAAALGVYLGIRNARINDHAGFMAALNKVSRYIAGSRPTARNLFWGLERMKSRAAGCKGMPAAKVKKVLLREALKIIDEDKQSCRRIGDYGQGLIKDKARILTICNAGALATIDYGTALGVIYSARAKGKRLKVYSLETRPLLQGARLSAWELKKQGVDVTIVCDNMAAILMQQGMVDLVIAGADRIAANGDAANKIGTLGLAVLARYHRIPFYIAAPASTFDLSIHSGDDILIEERDPREVSTLLFRKEIAPKGVRVFNPAFDVTPNGLVSAIITDEGLIRPPYSKGIAALIGR